MNNMSIPIHLQQELPPQVIEFAALWARHGGNIGLMESSSSEELKQYRREHNVLADPRYKDSLRKLIKHFQEKLPQQQNIPSMMYRGQMKGSILAKIHAKRRMEKRKRQRENSENIERKKLLSSQENGVQSTARENVQATSGQQDVIVLECSDSEDDSNDDKIIRSDGKTVKLSQSRSAKTEDSSNGNEQGWGLSPEAIELAKLWVELGTAVSLTERLKIIEERASERLRKRFQDKKRCASFYANPCGCLIGSAEIDAFRGFRRSLMRPKQQLKSQEQEGDRTVTRNHKVQTQQSSSFTGSSSQNRETSKDIPVPSDLSPSTAELAKLWFECSIEGSGLTRIEIAELVEKRASQELAEAIKRKKALPSFGAFTLSLVVPPKERKSFHEYQNSLSSRFKMQQLVMRGSGTPTKFPKCAERPPRTNDSHVDSVLVFEEDPKGKAVLSEETVGEGLSPEVRELAKLWLSCQGLVRDDRIEFFKKHASPRLLQKIRSKEHNSSFAANPTPFLVPKRDIEGFRSYRRYLLTVTKHSLPRATPTMCSSSSESKVDHHGGSLFLEREVEIAKLWVRIMRQLGKVSNIELLGCIEKHGSSGLKEWVQWQRTNKTFLVNPFASLVRMKVFKDWCTYRDSLLQKQCTPLKPSNSGDDSGCMSQNKSEELSEYALIGLEVYLRKEEQEVAQTWAEVSLRLGESSQQPVCTYIENDVTLPLRQKILWTKLSSGSSQISLESTLVRPKVLKYWRMYRDYLVAKKAKDKKVSDTTSPQIPAQVTPGENEPCVPERAEHSTSSASHAHDESELVKALESLPSSAAMPVSTWKSKRSLSDFADCLRSDHSRLLDRWNQFLSSFRSACSVQQSQPQLTSVEKQNRNKTLLDFTPSLKLTWSSFVSEEKCLIQIQAMDYRTMSDRLSVIQMASVAPYLRCHEDGMVGFLSLADKVLKGCLNPSDDIRVVNWDAVLAYVQKAWEEYIKERQCLLCAAVSKLKPLTSSSDEGNTVM